jgi:hypothetical protein
MQSFRRSGGVGGGAVVVVVAQATITHGLCVPHYNYRCYLLLSIILIILIITFSFNESILTFASHAEQRAHARA